MKRSLEYNADDVIYLKIPEIYEDNPSTKFAVRRNPRSKDIKCSKFVKDIIVELDNCMMQQPCEFFDGSLFYSIMNHSDHRWRITIHMAMRPVSDITTESAIFIFLSILSTIRRAFYKKIGGRMREFTACLFIAIIQSMEEHLVVSALESSLLFIEGLNEIFSLDFHPYEATQPIWEHDGVIGYIVQHTMLQLISIASLPAQHARSPSPICIKAWETTQRCCDAVEEDFRAGIGQCWFLGLDSGTVAWKSRMSKLVSLSFTEAVIDALIEAIKDCMWMRGLLSELGYPQARPSVVFQDNKSALQLTNIDSIPTRTRHLANRLSFIKQEIERGTVELKYLPSWRMVADVLTKLLPANSHKS
jgi:hypothetical protein